MKFLHMNGNYERYQKQISIIYFTDNIIIAFWLFLMWNM